jgi:hypothetical protein
MAVQVIRSVNHHAVYTLDNVMVIALEAQKNIELKYTIAVDRSDKPKMKLTRMGAHYIYHNQGWVHTIYICSMGFSP